MTTAVLVTPQADIVPVSLPNNTKDRGVVYRAVLRYERYDVVALTNRLDMWLDDDGATSLLDITD